jgi:putative membrane protein insertion efficiency factor
MSAPATLPVLTEGRRGVVGAALIRVIGLYQGLRAGRPSPCRFWPTCSSYAVEAIERHGAGPGSLLALRRLVRCHPWGGRGVDPVPE